MNEKEADIAQVYGLMAMWALASYNPTELRRSCDLSQAMIQKRITALLKKIDDQLIASEYADLVDTVDESELRTACSVFYAKSLLHARRAS